MPQPQEIEALLAKVVAKFNQSSRKKIPAGHDAILYGKDGCLDSLALVTFIMMVEREVQSTFKFTGSLAEDKAFSQAHSPFRSLASLQEYLSSLLQKK